ncbi:uncharacterized protein ColSpa_07962 [Colletotrichum spaethianum]|uniref:Uncharacterized protein n=1 Tax=Colletotrichum spaethianum TaxID=700344 RepID=A0AA37P8V1_9PEZI|nr:uncharacterized protein ColSpa_07962 [Colletotrichum spaethianum]GKT47781.1 hypothetical protein ColSpa_07962 [Colletotrichum spaethianum]
MTPTHPDRYLGLKCHYINSSLAQTFGIGVIERLVGINRNPANAWVYNGTVIPDNIAVSMGEYHMLVNECQLPDLTAFRSER